MLAVLGAVLFLFAPSSHWSPQVVFAVLLVAGSLSYSGSMPLRGSEAAIDAGACVSALALVFLGPLPALCVIWIPDAMMILSGKRLVTSLANLLDGLASVLVGCLILVAFGLTAPLQFDNPAAYLALLLVCLGYVAVTYFPGIVIVDVLSDGLAFWPVVRRDFPNTILTEIAMCGATVLIAFAYWKVGIVGLLLVVGLVMLPRLLIPLMWRSKPIAELELTDATAVYAESLGGVLALDRSRARVLGDAATHLGGRAAVSNVDDFQDVMHIVLYCREDWDGEDGFPGVLSGKDIPIESRVLRVAEAWASLTARGTAVLAPEHALGELMAQAGKEFDPEVVAAARQIVQDDLLPVPSSTAREQALAKRSHKTAPRPAI
ncbi:MAG: HD domain-containing phosphohydrolase [Solirubrobacterales bacterium]